MKEIIKEIQRTEKMTRYEAVDGTVFDSKEECKQYENSAKGVLRNRLKPFIVNDKYNGWELLGGEEENKILAIAVPTEEAVDVILQNYYLDQPWILDETPKNFKKRVDGLVRQAFHDEDIILFGLNCDENLYIIDTRQNIIGRLNNLDKKKEEE